ncbi:MAG: hypothetical protein L7F77_07500 [Candidatus Magnetominusculus sp. LBB02]|nr:hypothetical protein [Candidatus Magnetominusculus sp. LBB02]
MAINRPSIRLLAMALKDRLTSGRCITYGVQTVSGTYNEIKKLLAAEGCSVREPDDASMAIGRTVQQDVLFKMLGFDTVESIDVSDREAPTHILNLNMPIDKSMHMGYSLVYDGGTTEHCFDIKEVLSNTVRLLKTGGIVIHHLPISGCLEHGYYQISPSLLFDFYRANNFTDIEAKIQICKSQNSGKSCYFNFTSPARLPNDFGRQALIFFTARKTAAHNDVIYPVQTANPEHYISNAKVESYLSAVYRMLPAGAAFNALQLFKKITCMYGCKRL